MWRTPLGNRVLRGAERAVFLAGLGFAQDMIEESIDDPDLFESGVEAFDELTPGSRLALLALVGKALCHERTPVPVHTAVNEAAIAAVYECVRIELVSEVEVTGEPGSPSCSTTWRRLVLEAIREGELVEEDDDDGDEPWPSLDLNCRDTEEWEHLVDLLAGEVLWDADYEFAPKFLDAPPDVARVTRKLLGITQNYYTTPAPDPTEAELKAIRRSLRELCRLPEPEEEEHARR